MSDFRDVKYTVFGYSSWVQFWSQNHPDGRAPRTDRKHEYPPDKPKAEFKKDVLEIITAMHKKTPLLDFENQKTKLERAIREGDK